MAQPIVPHLPGPRVGSRWSLPVLVVGAVASVVVGQLHRGLTAVGVLGVAVLTAKLLDELATKRAARRP